MITMRAEDVDEERVERVRALQAQVSSLAGRVQAARDEYIPLLEKDALLSAQSLTERLTALPSDVVDSSTSVRACLANVTEAKRVLKRASSNCSNSERMERVSDDVKATNKRARNVLDTLRIVSENAPDEESNNTITITMDGESLMLDASTPRKASVATPSIRREDQERAGTIPVAAQMNTTPPTSRGTPGTSTRPRALAIECSPHVTPRSRERRRVSASPRPPRSALPR